MFQIFIDNEEVICESNFEIKEEFMNPSSIELYKVYPKSWKGTNKLLTDYYYPDDYSKCKILRDGELYFTGIVKNSADMNINPLKPHYCSLQILDPSVLLSEGETLEFVIVNKTVEEAILQVINSISDYGFIAGNINIPESKNTVIGAYSTLNKAPFDIFQYLSLISETRWGTRMIDENTTAIDFYNPDLLDNLGTIECGKEYYNQNKIVDINYSYSTNDYRNKQIITSDEVFASIEQTENLIANGYSTSFNIEQKIGKIKSIMVGEFQKSFATKNDKNLGITTDFYYEVGSNVLETETIYSAGTDIKITYIPLVKGREVSYNSFEITRIKERLGRKGTISRYENRNDVTSSNELLSVSKSYIKFKGVAEVILTVLARKDFLKLGGKYQFNAPINKLNDNYLVKSKNTKVFQNGKILTVCYEYELTNSFDTENELNYFDNQRAKSNGNIEQGEYIARNIDIEDEVLVIFDNLKIEEMDVKGDNVLDSTLDSPFIS